MPSLEFANLPLVEVAVRLALAEPLPLSLARLADLFGRVRERFSLMDDAPNVEASPGRGDISVHLRRATAVRYEGHAQGLVLTVQPALVVMRWLASARGPAYPRFSALEDELWRCVADLEAVFPESRVRFDVANMTYLNFIETGATSVEEIIGRYFSDSVRPPAMPSDVRFHSINLSWRKAVDLRLIVERGEAYVGPEPMVGYRLVTVSGDAFTAEARPQAKVRELHDVLQELFLAVISDFAKKEWGYARPSV